MAAECLLGMMNRIVFQQLVFPEKVQTVRGSGLPLRFLPQSNAAELRTEQGMKAPGQRTMKQRILIGTRGSALAMAQTNEVVNSLRKVAPQVRCEVVSNKTQGDAVEGARTGALESKSVFTKEIEDSLIRGRVDLAFHSMKDLTTDLPQGLVIACVPKRVDPRDVLVTHETRRNLSNSTAGQELERAALGGKRSF